MISTSAGNRPRIDRRLDERQDSMKGLSRWLESARRLLSLDALALADASGCLIVGAGSARRCEEMAAIAPLSNMAGNPRDLRVAGLMANSAWLCAPNRQFPSEDWQAVRSGCLRILGWSDVGDPIPLA